ncbi:DUF1801 domain-containing protein [Nocardioides sp. MAH-18]|uniref:DUF1801 domain-containing protein n=1 Tax=Nocardioides agri TaxID=2682843 RepID=A0A6L6XRC0_9ACTN|nr:MULTISPECIES: DUF1801 domain-containing protein [unclassified Nocardioides]MBA2954995.1 DUF1801 domain-containing protein [Nocardioides sp. CGMCC 1.13656]MVQ49849.1 DUF1801 domain-containing protein [Nocardioides sp. MAH-18]
MATFETVDDYLASLDERQRTAVEEIERRVLAVAPDATGVIRYDIPTWQVGGHSLVHAGAWKEHVAVYPVPPEGDADLDRDLAPYVAGKGTLRLPYDDLPFDLVERVVRRLLESRG